MARIATRLLPPPLHEALRSARDEAVIAWMSGRSRLVLMREAGHGLKVHLGCGQDIRPGWLNVDLPMPQGTSWRPPRVLDNARFVAYDLRRGLPLPTACAAYIYSSHFFEHLTPEQGLQLMRDCYRTLEPGGVFRAALPDIPVAFRAYLDGDDAYFSDVENPNLPRLCPTRRSRVDYVNYAVYQFGEHVCIYDPETFVCLLRAIGFSAAQQTDYMGGIDVSSDLRRRYSFYVEAKK